jgi:hypothetical protein
MLYESRDLNEENISELREERDNVTSVVEEEESESG